MGVIVAFMGIIVALFIALITTINSRFDTVIILLSDDKVLSSEIKTELREIKSFIIPMSENADSLTINRKIDKLDEDGD